MVLFLSLHMICIDGLELCRLLLDYCDAFISFLESHSESTHSLHMIHWCASDTKFLKICFHEETNSSQSWIN